MFNWLTRFLLNALVHTRLSADRTELYLFRGGPPHSRKAVLNMAHALLAIAENMKDTP